MNRLNGVLGQISFQLKALPSSQKIIAVVIIDAVLLTGCVLLAYILRLSSLELPPAQSAVRYFMAPFLSIIALAFSDVYRNSSRNFSLAMEQRLIFSQIIVAPVWASILLLIGVQDFARSVIAIYCVLAILALILARRLAASLLSGTTSSLRSQKRVPIMIVGAGEEAVGLAAALERQGRHKLLAFLDSDYTLVGRRISGKPVVAIENLDEAVIAYGPREILIAKADMSRGTRQQLVEKLLKHDLSVKTVPGLDRILESGIDLDTIRPISLSDLLGRDSVPPDRLLMERAVKGRVVLVTGAGGSIGSELVRQIRLFLPRSIVMVDISEFALFEIHRELERVVESAGEKIILSALLGDVKDKTAMTQLMQEHQVEVVFHAAAYKHVRLVQENPSVGIQNNVVGTMVLANAAVATGVKLFVLISTDKAVRPTSIMGASKRVAEMVIQALAARIGSKPVFAIVRFGNVLGSTGSVVPIFKDQIERGGPVTVTDPEVMRYFMLIPEAAQLVVQAAGMADGGDVFVLDMGVPVKITQLAKTMIELAGRVLKSPENPLGDIAIKFTGLKDGEKLYEELQIGHQVLATQHPRIMKSREFFLGWRVLKPKLDKITQSAAARRSAMAVKIVKELAGLSHEQDSKP